MTEDVSVLEGEFEIVTSDLIKNDTILPIPLDDGLGTIVQDDILEILESLQILLRDLDGISPLSPLNALTDPLTLIVSALKDIVESFDIKSIVNSIVDVVAVDNAKESAPVEITVPSNPSVLTKPLITLLNPLVLVDKDGYRVSGQSTDANRIVVEDSQGNLVANLTVNARMRSIPLGQFEAVLRNSNIEPGELLSFTAYADQTKGNTLQQRVPTQTPNPSLPNPPSNVTIESKDDNYIINGNGTPGDTVIIRDADGNVLAESIVDANGKFPSTISKGDVKPGDTLVITSERNGVEGNPIFVIVPSQGNLPGTGQSNAFQQFALMLIALGTLLVINHKTSRRKYRNI